MVLHEKIRVNEIKLRIANLDYTQYLGGQLSTY